MTQKFLLNNIAVDAATADADGVATLGSAVNIDVGSVSLGGGTVSIFGSLDGGTTRTLLAFEDGTPMQVTSNGISQIARLANGYRLYAALTGSTAADSVTVQVVY